MNPLLKPRITRSLFPHQPFPVQTDAEFGILKHRMDFAQCFFQPIGDARCGFVLDEHLQSVTVFDFGNRRRHRPQELAFFRQVSSEKPRQPFSLFHQRHPVGMTDEDRKQSAIWRIKVLFANHAFLPVKRFIPISRRAFDTVMIRTVSLDHHFSRLLMPARPSTHLRQQLECPFRRPEIRQVEHGIRRDHTHQRHAGKVESFGDHLRPQQDIRFSFPKSREKLFMGSFPARGIHIHPDHADPWKTAGQFLFHPLRSGAEMADMRTLAVRAYGRNPFRIAAIVASHSSVGLVVGE